MASASFFTSSPSSSRPSAVRRWRRISRMARACSSDSRIVPVLADQMARIGDQLDQGLDVAGRPVARHQLFARRRGIRRSADQSNDLVDIGDGDGEADQRVAAVARLAQLEARPPRHHLLAEGREGADHRFEVHQLRPAAVQRQHVHAERGLQFGEAIELIEDDFGGRIALEFDHDAHAVAVAFVADVRDAPRRACRGPVRPIFSCNRALFTW